MHIKHTDWINLEKKKQISGWAVAAGGKRMGSDHLMR